MSTLAKASIFVLVGAVLLPGYLRAQGSGVTVQISAKSGVSINGNTLRSLTASVLDDISDLTGQQAPTYTFQVVARTGTSINGSTITNFTTPPVLNDQGELVFAAALSDGQGIFTPDKVLVKTGQTIAGKTLTGITSPVLNNNGTLAFLGSFANGSGVFTPTALLAETGQNIGGQPLYNFYSGLSVNNKDEVAFEASTGSGYPMATGIFLTPVSGSPKQLLSTTQAVGGKTLNSIGTPVVSDAGLVAFRGEFLNSDYTDTTSLVTIDSSSTSGPNLPISSGTAVQGQTLTVFGYPSGVTTQDVAVIPASFDGGSGVLQVDHANGGAQNSTSQFVVKSGDTIGGKTLTQIRLATVNSAGSVAFYGVFQDGQGIFTPSALLVKTGDQIGLDTISSILFNSTAYNANGTIAFGVQFADGTKAIVEGQPVPQP